MGVLEKIKRQGGSCQKSARTRKGKSMLSPVSAEKKFLGGQKRRGGGDVPKRESGEEGFLRGKKKILEKASNYSHLREIVNCHQECKEMRYYIAPVRKAANQAKL